jgi:hypothetical protein
MCTLSMGRSRSRPRRRRQCLWPLLLLSFGFGFGRGDQMQSDNLRRKGRFAPQQIETAVDEIPAFKGGEIFEPGTGHRDGQLGVVAVGRYVLHVDGGRPHTR